MASIVVEHAGPAPEKGLKRGALGLISSVVIGVASTAPAYSLAATLGFVVVAIGLQAPIVTVLAFVPMYFISVGYQEMNRADPDCGTTFTWATRAFRPRVGWMGGWGVVAADVLVMASLAQIAGQYVFELFNANGIGGDASSVWVLLVGIGWIVAMTWICYVGIEISANFQKALLGIELTMLTVMSDLGPHPGRQRHGAGRTLARLVDVVRSLQGEAHQRLHHWARRHALHLLGLGHRSQSQRGDGRRRGHARQGRHLFDIHFAGDLRHRHPCDPVLRGHRHLWHRPRQLPTTRMTSSPSSVQPSSAIRPSRRYSTTSCC